MFPMCVLPSFPASPTCGHVVSPWRTCNGCLAARRTNSTSHRAGCLSLDTPTAHYASGQWNHVGDWVIKRAQATHDVHKHMHDEAAGAPGTLVNTHQGVTTLVCVSLTW
jgi:hypothetical protein